MTHVELDRIQEGELEQLLLQSALVTDRILGIGHEETRFRIMRLGAKYADSLQYQRYISLWGFCLRTRVEQQSLFNFQTCFTAEGKPIKLYKLYDGFNSSSAIGLVRVLLDLYLSQAAMNNVPEDARLSFADVFQIFELLATELEGECILQRFQFGRKVYNFSVFYSVPKTAENSSCVQETATELWSNIQVCHSPDLPDATNGKEWSGQGDFKGVGDAADQQENYECRNEWYTASSVRLPTKLH